MDTTFEVEKQDKGFTLVELLIVIVILGILSTVTVFAVRGITSDAQSNACEADERTLGVAIESYFADNPAVTSIAGGDDAARKATLVDAGLLRAPVTNNFAVNADGSVTGLLECAP
jgi:prepilin-type N-terminal cleavage/methylation domain-containing protein